VLRYVGGRRDWFAAGRGMAGRRARRVRAGDVARRDVPPCRPGDRIGEVRARVRAGGWDVCMVVNEAGVVFGQLGGAAWAAAGRTPVDAVMTTPTTYRPDALVAALRERMPAGRARALVITDSDGRLVGLVGPREAAGRPAAARPRRRRAAPASRSPGLR
jgi:CBS domain-containing protein